MNPLINTHSPESTTFTRYFCGCIYETCVDTTLICPQHRSEPHRAFMTATQTVPVPRDHAVDTISRLTPASHAGNRPMKLENRPDNSLHLLATITDPNQREWSAPEAEMVGLCPPCFVDHQMLTETGVSTCECPDPACYYRWCGRTTGLHALWRFHAYGKSEQFTGHREEDIFKHGPHDQLPDNLRSRLAAEREFLDLCLLQASLEFGEARGHSTPGAGRRRYYQPVYLSQWLEQDYRRLSRERDEEKRERLRTGLRHKLMRLIITSANGWSIRNPNPTHTLDQTPTTMPGQTPGQGPAA